MEISKQVIFISSCNQKNAFSFCRGNLQTFENDNQTNLVQNNFWCYIFWRPTKGPCLTTKTDFLGKTKVDLKQTITILLGYHRTFRNYLDTLYCK